MAGVLLSTAVGIAGAVVYVGAAIEYGAAMTQHVSLDALWLRAAGVVVAGVQGAALFLFLRDAQRNPELDDRGRTRWGIAHALVAPVSMPLYWRRYLRG